MVLECSQIFVWIKDSNHKEPYLRPDFVDCQWVKKKQRTSYAFRLVKADPNRFVTYSRINRWFVIFGSWITCGSQRGAFTPPRSTVVNICIRIVACSLNPVGLLIPFARKNAENLICGNCPSAHRRYLAAGIGSSSCKRLIEYPNQRQKCFSAFPEEYSILSRKVCLSVCLKAHTMESITNLKCAGDIVKNAATGVRIIDRNRFPNTLEAVLIHHSKEGEKVQSVFRIILEVLCDHFQRAFKHRVKYSRNIFRNHALQKWGNEFKELFFFIVVYLEFVDNDRHDRQYFRISSISNVALVISKNCF